MQVIITKCELSYADGEYKSYLVSGTADGVHFSVATDDGQYDYVDYPENIGDDDEPIQIAIGEYMEKHGIDPGKVHR